jgi:hypothetical protein
MELSHLVSDREGIDVATISKETIFLTYTNIPLLYRKSSKKLDSKAEAEEKAR